MTPGDIDHHERRILSAFGSGLDHSDAYDSAIKVLTELRRLTDPAVRVSEDATTEDGSSPSGAHLRATAVLLGIAEDPKVHVDVRVAAARAVVGGGR